MPQRIPIDIAQPIHRLCGFAKWGCGFSSRVKPKGHTLPAEYGNRFLWETTKSESAGFALLAWWLRITTTKEGVHSFRCGTRIRLTIHRRDSSVTGEPHRKKRDFHS